ncbi:hypothetical protein [Hoeflea sp.]|uniref:hypothetical protein n=1 Tax=Hoeflea sp. TaxID=1940281 RepID=UPI003A959145
MAGPKTGKQLSVAQQFLFLRNSELCAGSGNLANGHIIWRFKASPTPLSREYEIEIDYKQNEVPNIRVLQPDLNELAKGRDIPHVYRKPLRLCLYLPRKQQWHAGLRIDRTIIPWAILWLYYFEEWLATDDWKGEGEHPDPATPTEGSRRDRRYLQRNHYDIV